jgi:5'-nucleotidase
MAEGRFDLAQARVLIANDDGIEASGLKVLEKAVREIVREVWVVAPETEQSAASHSLTIRRPLRLRRVSERRFAVDGTPTDCVLMGITRIMADSPPDLVLSGVNRGSNMGEDLIYSGTVAAAIEAALLGYPAIAFSQVSNDRRAVKWGTAEKWIPEVLRRLAEVSWPSDVVINVNFPDVAARSVTGIRVGCQGRHEKAHALTERIDLRGEPYFWVGSKGESSPGLPGSDLDVASNGAIAITPVRLDLTHGETMQALKRHFE